MFGDGALAFLSLKLGEENKDEAAIKELVQVYYYQLLFLWFYTFVVLIFLLQLLNFLDVLDELRDYATSYGRISAIGFPFYDAWCYVNSID